MATLDVELRDLFLVVHDVKGRVDGLKRSVVLFPDGLAQNRAHRLTIEGPSVGAPVTVPARSDITFVRMTTELTGQAKKIKTNVLDLKTLGAKVQATVELPYRLVDKDRAVESVLNARVWLPKNLAEARSNNRHANAAGVKWNFKQNGASKHTQELADILNLELDIKGGTGFGLIVRTGPDVTLIPLTPHNGDGDISVTFLNKDTDAGCINPPPPGQYTLIDFKLLYALTNAPDLPVPDGELPAGDQVHMLSACLPICGGAECDPPDPPDPPDP